MERAADMVRDRAEGTGGTTAQAGTKVADTMETAAGYMREHDVNEMWTDLETYARTHPTQALIGAVVTGFLVGRLIR
jgi:phage-related minor tail protein